MESDESETPSQQPPPRSGALADQLETAQSDGSISTDDIRERSGTESMPDPECGDQRTDAMRSESSNQDGLPEAPDRGLDDMDDRFRRLALQTSEGWILEETIDARTEKKVLDPKKAKEMIEIKKQCGITIEDERKFYETMRITTSGIQRACAGLTVQDLRRLGHDQWLNDEIVNAFMKLFQKHNGDGREAHPVLKCHFFNSFFLQKLLTNYDFDDVKGWTSPKRLKRWGQPSPCLLDCDLIFFPLYSFAHWSLVVANLKSDAILLYDSMNMAPCMREPPEQVNTAMQLICKYLIDEAWHKLGKDWTERSFEFLVAQDTPQQGNCCDCGVFLIQNARHLSTERPLIFSQEQMHDYRIVMFKELQQQRILC